MMFSSELMEFCEEHKDADVHLLALHAKKYLHINMQQAIAQIKGRQTAKDKLPLWYNNSEVIYPQHISMEQCSSEKTALYKQKLCTKGATMVDLTGGFGVDCSFLSQDFDKAIYVEQQEQLVTIAKHNFKALGLDHIDVQCAEATAYLEIMDEVDLIYIDPARRDTQGRKTVLIVDCTPNLLEIQDLLETKAKKVMIKLSPMLDISLALKSLTNVAEVHIVSADNECKELLFVKDANHIGDVDLHCVNIYADVVDVFSFTRESEDNTTLYYKSSLGSYLYEPNASIMKAGAYKSICSQYEVNKLHVSSHLYTSTDYIQNFPGRKFRIKTTTTLNKKDLQKSLSGINQANITVRNFPMKVDELRKKLKLKDGGDNYVFATTLSDNSKVLIICERL